MASVVNLQLEIFNQIAQVLQSGIKLVFLGGGDRVELAVESPKRRHPVGGGSHCLRCRRWLNAIAAGLLTISDRSR